MADPVSMSLDDYIKSKKKTGKMSYGGRGGGSGRRGAKAARGGAGGGGGGGPAASSYGNRRGQNSFRGRRGRPSTNNVQRRWGGGNGGFGNRQFTGNGSNFPKRNGLGGGRGGGGGQGGAMGSGPNRRNQNPKRRNRNPNRQVRRQRNSGVQQGQQGLTRQPMRYFNRGNIVATGSTAVVPKPKRNVARRIRARLAANQAALAVVAPMNTKRTFLKFAKKRVQRAKLLVSRKNAAMAGPGKLRGMVSVSGRVALSKNGFITVRNNQAKEIERNIVQMKIARAQRARNRQSPQQAINLPGPSNSRNRTRNVRARARPVNNNVTPRPLDWNTSIVRTMRNDLVDEMSNSQLNPDIQRKIAFIQSRSNRERAPVMPDFRAPVTTSRMKLSDRFRLLNDQFDQ